MIASILSWSKELLTLLTIKCVISISSYRADTIQSKNLLNLKNFYSFMIKFTKTSILPNCQVPNVFLYKCKFYHSRIEVLQNCSAFYCVSFLWPEKIWEDWKDYFYRKIQPRSSCSKLVVAEKNVLCRWICKYCDNYLKFSLIYKLKKE